MNLDFKDTAGWKLMQQQERNETFFRQQELKLKQRKNNSEKDNSKNEKRADT